MSPHGIAESPDQSLRNSANKRHLAKPLTLPDFIAISQTVYEKSVTHFLYRSLFWRSGRPPGPKFTSLGGDV